MEDFFGQVWMDNSVRKYLIVAGVILFVWILRRVISRYFAGLLYRLVRGIWKDVDRRSFVNLVIRPLGSFLAILVSIIALYKLNFPKDLDVDLYKYTTKQIIHCVGSIVLIISFTNLLIRMVDFIALILEKRADLTPDQMDNQLIVFFKDFFKVILVIIGIMLVLRFAFGLNIGGLLTGLSILGAAIALALRESLENLIASFIIFFDKPFILGDLVKVQHVTGSVEKIGLRSTRIRTDQKTFVTVPNKQMVDSILDNLSLRSQRRGDLRLDLDISTESSKLESLVKGLRKMMERRELENANVFLSEISGNSAVILSDYYTAPVTLKEFNELKEEINLHVLKMVEEFGIDMAGTKTILVSKDIREHPGN